MKDTFKVGRSYSYSFIDSFYESNNQNMTMEEYGEDIIGESFIVLKEGDNTVSFIMDGASGIGCSYKCIYVY